jgi:hypothetical protein
VGLQGYFLTVGWSILLRVLPSLVVPSVWVSTDTADCMRADATIGGRDRWAEIVDEQKRARKSTCSVRVQLDHKLLDG